MEYNNWKDADIYCEKVLDVEPTNPTAYLYKLLIECKAVSIDELSQKAILIERSANYKKAVNFSDNLTKEKLDLCRKQCIYNTASDTAKRTNNYSGYIDAMQIFASISGFSDSEKQKRVCVDKAKECLTSKINQSKYVFTMHNDSLRQLEEKTAELHKEKQKHQISVQDLEKMNKKLANTRKWTIAYCVLWILSFALSAIITIAHDEPLTFSTVFWAGLLFFAIPGTCILGFINSICDKSAKKRIEANKSTISELGRKITRAYIALSNNETSVSAVQKKLAEARKSTNELEFQLKQLNELK